MTNRTMKITFLVAEERVGSILADLADRVGGLAFEVVENLPAHKNKPKWQKKEKTKKAPKTTKEERIQMVRDALADGETKSFTYITDALKARGYPSPSTSINALKDAVEAKVITKTAPGQYKLKGGK